MIDLHCHSTQSDGKLTPQQVVQLAAKNGCTLLSLTDHDHTGGLNIARIEAKKHGLPFVNGVEISVTWRSKTIHIVGLDFDENNSTLQNLLRTTRTGRLERLEKIADKLSKKGIQGAAAGALSLASTPEMVSRTHLADWLVQQGHVRNKQRAFAQYLGDGKYASVPHQWAQLDEAIDAILSAQGIAVIAHPMRYNLSASARANLFEEFKQHGGQAIEVHSGSCRLNDRLNYALIAQKYNFWASVGSDFHRLGDYSGSTLGVSPELPAICEPVWQHFKSTQY